MKHVERKLFSIYLRLGLSVPIGFERDWNCIIFPVSKTKCRNGILRNWKFWILFNASLSYRVIIKVKCKQENFIMNKNTTQLFILICFLLLTLFELKQVVETCKFLRGIVVKADNWPWSAKTGIWKRENRFPTNRTVPRFKADQFAAMTAFFWKINEKKVSLIWHVYDLCLFRN